MDGGILRRGADADDRRLIAHALDRMERAGRGELTCVGFLDPRKRALLEPVVRGRGPYLFDGGIDGAERTLCLFLPDYLSGLAPEELRRLPEYPARALKICSRAPDAALSHRDYLGALMAQGVRREAVGDLWLCGDGCALPVLAEVAEHIVRNLECVGNVGVTVELIGFHEVEPPERRTRELRGTVASLRLDAVVGEAFGMPRAKAQEAVRAGLATLNWAVETKPDAAVREGDTLSVRGRGKVLLDSASRVTKKGNIAVVFLKYI